MIKVSFALLAIIALTSAFSISAPSVSSAGPCDASVSKCF